ncbi:MAG: hypothetical protein PHW96_03520 [Candidatus Nanoarchaeia archaeon]|nr:hypothetical protein [Candidatus Nanoarchaeia archaeon]
MKEKEVFDCIVELTKNGKFRLKVDDLFSNITEKFSENKERYTIDSLFEDLSFLIDVEKSIRYNETWDALEITPSGQRKNERYL